MSGGVLKRLRNLILQLAFKSLQISSFKWLQRSTKFDSNAAKTAFFFAEKSQKLPSAWGLRPQTPICNMRELHQFAQDATQFRRFSGKKDLALGSSSPLPKSWLYVREILFLYRG